MVITRGDSSQGEGRERSTTFEHRGDRNHVGFKLWEGEVSIFYLYILSLPRLRRRRQSEERMKTFLRN